MSPRVEVIREPGVAATPRILVQLREDDPTFAMTVSEAWAYIEKEEAIEAAASGYSADCSAGGSRHCECAVCLIYDALQGLA